MPAQVETSLIQVLPAQVSLITALFEKDISKIIIPKEFVTPNKVVTPKKIPSDIQKGHPVVQAYNNIKDKNLVLTQLLTISPEYNIHLDFYIWPPYKQISLFGALSDMLKASITWFAIHHWHYKENSGITESTYNPFFFQLFRKRIFLLGVSYNYIVKFAIYHPYYKEKFWMIESIYNSFILW